MLRKIGPRFGLPLSMALLAPMLLLVTVQCYGQSPVTRAYGPSPAQIADVCLPSDGLKGRPAALLIHGGGWVHGDKIGFQERCKSFAVNGIVAVSINYRLADAAVPSTRWPAQLEDAKVALQWMIDNADELGLDAGRICAYGESSGGHIALWLGIADKRVASIVDAFGPTELSRLGKPFERAFDALIGRTETFDQGLRAASPLWSLGPDLQPTLIIHGQRDTLVPPDQSYALFESINRNGTSVDAIIYPGGHSWLELSPQSLKAILAQMMSFIKTAPDRRK